MSNANDDPAQSNPTSLIDPKASEIDARLKIAIETVQPVRLRRTLQELCQMVPDAHKVTAALLLATQQKYKEKIQASRAAHGQEDSREDEDEDEDDDEEESEGDDASDEEGDSELSSDEEDDAESDNDSDERIERSAAGSEEEDDKTNDGGDATMESLGTHLSRVVYDRRRGKAISSLTPAV